MVLNWSLCTTGLVVWRCPPQNRAHDDGELDDWRCSSVLKGGGGDTGGSWWCSLSTVS
jgi:hypothetical protein